MVRISFLLTEFGAALSALAPALGLDARLVRQRQPRIDQVAVEYPHLWFLQ